MALPQRLLQFFILLFTVSLFFPFGEAAKSITAVALVAFIIACPAVRVPFKWSAIPRWVYCCTAFFIWLLFTVAYSSNTEDAGKFILKRLPLLLFPLSLALVVWNKQTKNRTLLHIAYIVVACCVYALINASIHVSRTGETGYLYNDALSVHIGQQSIYTSLFVNASIFIIGNYWLKLPKFSTSYWVHSALLLFLFLISYLLASRNMMLLLYASIFVMAVWFIIQNKKYKLGVALIAALVIGFFAVYTFFPKTINRFKELGVTNYNYSSRAAESHYDGNFSAEQWNGANFRLAAWSCGWQLFKEHPVFGTGIGDKRDELNRVYAERDFHFAISTKKNVHNNYLDILYSTGIIGLLLFLTGWIILPFVHYIRQKNRLAILIHICLLFAMITEVYFDRSLGPFSLAFWTSILTTHTAD